VKIRLILAIALLGVLGGLQSGSGLAQSLQLPCRFYGTVQVNCDPVPDGTVIEAVIDGDTYAATTTGEIYWDSTYEIIIVPTEGKAYDDGTPVYFKIDGQDALQYGFWESGGNVEIDLTDSCVRTRVETVFVSDTSTLVAVSINGVTYGTYHPAVPAYVFAVHPEIEGAMWISNVYKAGYPYRATWRKFERSFTLQVPDDATNFSGILEIAGDNTYTVYCNGVNVGSDSDVFSVETWSLPLVRGDNILTIVVKNTPQDRSLTFSNPTGVIYRLTAGYDVPPEVVPTSSPTTGPTPTPTVTPTPTSSAPAGPTTSPARPTASPASVPAHTDGWSTSQTLGVLFFGMVDVILIGLFVYLIWRFFVHPRAPGS